jgi:helix-turn-helix, Psq domain
MNVRPSVALVFENVIYPLICRIFWVILAIRRLRFSIQMSKGGSTYTEADVVKALQAVNNGTSLREAARTFQVPKSTICDRMTNKTTTTGYRDYRTPLFTFTKS